MNTIQKEVISQFDFPGEVVECVAYGSGHINDTYRLTVKTPGGQEKHFILQRMNKSIFTKPVELMENVQGVTAWLRKKIRENGGDVERETLNVVNDKDGNPYYVDSEGEYWRVYLFIEGATSYDMVKDCLLYTSIPDSLYESASLEGAGRIKQFFSITLPLIWTNIRTTLTFFVISTITVSYTHLKAM